MTVEINNRRWIERKLRSLRLVEWDRFTVGEWADEQYVNVYGWINRDDGYKDFVNVIFWAESEGLYHITSSAEHSEAISETLHGESGDGGHNDCQRVEDTFNVENAIQIAE